MILWTCMIFFVGIMVKDADSTVVENPYISGVTEVVEQESTTLTCNGVCTNKYCSYSWSGLNVQVISGNTLYLPNVTRTMDGETYKCTVRDPGDLHSHETETKLTVYFGPDNSASIKTKTESSLSSLTVTENDTSDDKAIICSSGKCNPTCRISWSGSTMVSQAQNASSVNLFPTNRLIKRKDATTYTCTITNDKAPSFKRTLTIKLIVQYPPDVSMKWNSSMKQLVCDAEGVPANYTFSDIVHIVNNVKVRKLPVTTVGGHASVSFPNPTFQDNGIYECEVGNGIPPQQKNAIMLPFDDEPQILQSPASYNVSKGSHLTLFVTVYAIPKITMVHVGTDKYSFSVKHLINLTFVELSFYGVRVRTEGLKVEIELDNVTEESFTNVTITLQNNVGTNSTTVALLPQGPPDTPINLTVNFHTHESVTLLMKTGFFNGAPQTLVLQYKISGNTTDWINGTSQAAGSQKHKQVKLHQTGLQPETIYSFRTFSYNEYAISAYTDIVKQRTGEVPAPAIAIAVGVVGGVISICLVVALVMYRKRRLRKSGKKDTSHMDLNKDMTIDISTKRISFPTTHRPVSSANAIAVDATGYSEDTNEDSQELYINTPFSHKRDKKPDYVNTNIKTNSDKVVYRKTGDNPEKINVPSYVELVAEEKDTVEEAYLNMDLCKDIAKKNADKTGRQLLERPCENITKTEGAKEYENVEPLKKKEKKTNEISVDDGDYLDMEINSQKTSVDHRKKKKKQKNTGINLRKPKGKKDKESETNVKTSNGENVTDRQEELPVPDYAAPPPPKPVICVKDTSFEEEGQYMNIKIGKSGSAVGRRK